MKTDIGPEQQRVLNNQMGFFYLFVAAVVTLSWAAGAFGFSFYWVFCLAALLFLVWRTKFARLLKRQVNLQHMLVLRKRALRQCESVEWANFLLNRWWVFSSSTIENLVKKRLDDRLLEIKPSFLKHIELTAFTMGEDTPTVRHIQVFEFAEGVPRGLKPVSWLDITKPPTNLEKMASFKLVMEMDLDVVCHDFHMVFKIIIGRLGFDIAVEELTITGKMQTILELSMDVPFPHITKATFYFTDKPDVWFNIKVLGALQIMEVPLLKSWIHTSVLEGLTKALVDPGKLDLILASAGPVYGPRQTAKKNAAQGVLTVHIKGLPSSYTEQAVDDVHYCVARLGDRKRQTVEFSPFDEWEDISSFLVYKLSEEKLTIKSKCKRLLTSVTLEEHTLKLSLFPFQVENVQTTTLKNKNGTKLNIFLQYTRLEEIKLDVTKKDEQQIAKEVAGVLYVHIHGATNLLAADDGGKSDPYCVVFCDRRRIMTTPYITQTVNPKWESHTEFFVRDFTKSRLSFFVFDWDGRNVIDDDFLGSAHLNISMACKGWDSSGLLYQKEASIVRKTLPLGYDKPSSGHVAEKRLGQLVVSIIFRPVSSVAKSESYRPSYEDQKHSDKLLYTEDKVSPASVAIQHSRKSLNYVEKFLAGKSFVDLKILKARDLEPKDYNGFSDPFCEVLMGKKKVFNTSVKKKTLTPVWNESVTLEIPDNVKMLELRVIDKDILSSDSMGQVMLSVNKMKEMSHVGRPEWFDLQRSKSGFLQLQCSMTDKETVSKENHLGTIQEPVEEFSKDALSDSRLKSPAFENTVNNQSSVAAISPDNSKCMLTESPIIHLKRSISDANISKHKRNKSHDVVPDGPTLKPSDSVNSLCMYNTDDQLSLDGSISTIDRYFGVSGTVVQGKCRMLTDSDIYCKVRLEHHRTGGSLSRLRSAGRILARTSVIKCSSELEFNLQFEVDRGYGVSADDCLIFDIKKKSKEHLAMKGFRLQELFADSENGKVRKWLTLNNTMSIEVHLAQGKPDPRFHKRHGIFKHFSFRKEKHH